MKALPFLALSIVALVYLTAASTLVPQPKNSMTYSLGFMRPWIQPSLQNLFS